MQLFSLLLLAACAVPLRASDAPLLNVGKQFLMKSGDGERWSAPDFDDSGWKAVALKDVPAMGDSVWLRKRVDTTKLGRRGDRPLALYFAGLASHEIWWDGERIGAGGVVGRTPQSEVAGPIEAHYQIPDRLAAPGVHLLAVRTSAFHRHFQPKRGYWAIIVGDYDAIAALNQRGALIALMALSGIVLTGAFGLAMFVTRRDRTYLLLGTLCVAAAALLIAEKWRPLFGYTYDVHIVRLLIIAFLSWVVGAHVVALTASRFPIRNARRVFFITVAASAIGPFLVPGWDTKAVFIFVVCFGVSLVWAIDAMRRKLPGSALAVTGLSVALLALAAQPLRFVDDGVYFALNFLFICLLCAHALQVRSDEEKRTAALLKSARLELESTKRHMQPHFLMNTLTALSQWIEEDPRTAIAMIEALADEVRALRRMSARRLVTVGQELRLCRSHLTTMSLRKEIRYALHTEGIEAHRMVPPTVFHTLVENAVTHGPSSQGDVLLRLAAERKGEHVQYTFESPLEAGEETSFAPGDGTRYIEARLAEVWGDAWSLRQAPVGATWQVQIEVPA
ncbi:MAG TPA: sensor histidine kinase [Thermoanaerobaculia bacterium]|jgi:hypothetical protein|nr:sensor histidine kinase [Thermoanaerobaculia bacterium]